jgi:predicted alpha/beta hydrolase
MSLTDARKIQYRDNATNQVVTFQTKEKADTTLICLPAMGVRASYYESFADNLCGHGFNVVTADWRGQGKSSVRASKKINFGYEEIIGDLKELIEHTDKWFPSTKKIIVGHSLGGQIGSLFASRYPNLINGLILITSCSVFYKGWDRIDRVKLYIAGNSFYLLSRIIGHFPGRIIGFGGREARTVIKDWCYNAIYGEYKLANSNHNYELSLKKMNKPVLSFSVEDDQLASRTAIENLLKKFDPQASIFHLHLTSDLTNISPLNHFSWAKDPNYLGQQIRNWLRDNIELQSDKK